MKFKLDNNFLAFCGSMDCGKPCDLVSRELADRFMEKGMLTDSPFQEYGLIFMQACGPSSAGDVKRVLADYFGVRTVSEDAYDLFLHSIVFGDGDCPICGGKLYLDHEEGHTEYSWRNEFPPEYVIEEQTWRCEVCDYERVITF